MKLIKVITVAVAMLLSLNAAAIDKANAEFTKEQLQGHFPNTTFEHIEESPIPGITAFYIVNSEDYRILYWHAKTQTLIFGEMVDKTGMSHTAKAIAEFKAGKMKDLDTSNALKIGSGRNIIIEFVDPECVYCSKYNDFISDRDDVTRYIFFHNPMGKGHPGADVKSIHVLCSTDPQRALNDVYRNAIEAESLNQCQEGISQLDEHNDIAKQFKVSGTPTLIVNGTVVAGFRKTQVEKLLLN